VEPFAGGAGAGIKLLREGHVDRIIINDRDRAVFSFWNAVMRRTGEMVDRILHAPLSIEEWKCQRDIYRRPGRRGHVDLGFAAFYLNRCNRSGIVMNGGPIGGLHQSGKWRLDARFDREKLAAKVRDIAAFGDRVVVLCEDAGHLLARRHELLDGGECFIYADPPYYVKGRELYMSHYRDADHQAFAADMLALEDAAWVMTYDDVPQIRKLYRSARLIPFKLQYSAHEDSQSGGEVLIAPHHVQIPSSARKGLAERSALAESR